MRDDPDCLYCGEIETMEHLYFGYEYYSKLQWTDLGKYRTSQVISKTNSIHLALNQGQRIGVFNQELTYIRLG